MLLVVPLEGRAKKKTDVMIFNLKSQQTDVMIFPFKEPTVG